MGAAAHLLDNQAMETFSGARGKIKTPAYRMVFAYANTLRSTSEGLKRYSESLMRKVNAIEEDRQTAKRRRIAERHAADIKTQETERHARSRQNFNEMVKRAGCHPPGPPERQMIEADGASPSSAEVQYLPPVESREIRGLVDSGDAAGAMQQLNSIRARWRAEHDAKGAARSVTIVL